MTRSRAVGLGLALASLAVTGCFNPKPQLAVLTPGLAPVPADSVRVMAAASDSCTAVVQVEEPASDRTKAIDAIKTDAAAHGANVVVLGQTREKTTTGNKVMWGALASSSSVLEAMGYHCPK